MFLQANYLQLCNIFTVNHCALKQRAKIFVRFGFTSSFSAFVQFFLVQIISYSPGLPHPGWVVLGPESASPPTTAAGTSQPSPPPSQLETLRAEWSAPADGANTERCYACIWVINNTDTIITKWAKRIRKRKSGRCDFFFKAFSFLFQASSFSFLLFHGEYLWLWADFSLPELHWTQTRNHF